MRKQPFFSMIVPAHNAAEYMRKGIKSIRKQKFEDYELIIVCDACEDRTEHIARFYGDVVITTDFGRDGLARNAGIDAASGKWLLFMDDDDWLLHEYVFTQLHEALSRVEVDVLAFSFIWRNVGYTRQVPYDVKYAVWNKAWRREFVGETRFPAVESVSDVGFTDAVMAKHPRVSFWDMPMYYYNYLRPGSISWQEEKRKELERGKGHERADGRTGRGGAADS